MCFCWMWAHASLMPFFHLYFPAGHRVFRCYSSKQSRSQTPLNAQPTLTLSSLSNPHSLCFSGYPLHPLARKQDKGERSKLKGGAQSLPKEAKVFMIHKSSTVHSEANGSNSKMKNIVLTGSTYVKGYRRTLFIESNCL
jgi:hypothetical protein